MRVCAAILLAGRRRRHNYRVVWVAVLAIASIRDYESIGVPTSNRRLMSRPPVGFGQK